MKRRGGIVLGGGASRRMMRSKASLPFGSESMLQRTARLLAQAVDEVVVVLAVDQKPMFEEHNVSFLNDRKAGLGPVEGLSVGFAGLSPEVDDVFVAACDAPFLNTQLIRRLLDDLTRWDVALPILDGVDQPLTAAYRRRAVSPLLVEMLATGHLCPLDLFETLNVCRWDEVRLLEFDANLASFINVNTPQDYVRALELAGLPRHEEP